MTGKELKTIIERKGFRALAAQRHDCHLYQTRHQKGRCSQPPRH